MLSSVGCLSAKLAKSAVGVATAMWWATISVQALVTVALNFCGARWYAAGAGRETAAAAAHRRVTG